MPTKRSLADNEVREIVELYQQPMGIARIEKITGINIWLIRSVVSGQTYTDITGGINLRRGLRKDAIWRHGAKSYDEVQKCLQSS